MLLVVGLFFVAGCGDGGGDSADDNVAVNEARNNPTRSGSGECDRDRGDRGRFRLRPDPVRFEAAGDLHLRARCEEQEQLLRRVRRGLAARFHEGQPEAGKDIDRSLLGTTERRDGKLQVTYAGKPLYYYAHEGPGEVKCHNVNLNGGYWWVIGPDGTRRQ